VLTFEECEEVRRRVEKILRKFAGAVEVVESRDGYFEVRPTRKLTKKEEKEIHRTIGDKGYFDDFNKVWYVAKYKSAWISSGWFKIRRDKIDEEFWREKPPFIAYDSCFDFDVCYAHFVIHFSRISDKGEGWSAERVLDFLKEYTGIVPLETERFLRLEFRVLELQRKLHELQKQEVAK